MRNEQEVISSCKSDAIIKKDQGCVSPILMLREDISFSKNIRPVVVRCAVRTIHKRMPDGAHGAPYY
jgi:hypothetical protein